jgi:hypothetical protein
MNDADRAFAAHERARSLLAAGDVPGAIVELEASVAAYPVAVDDARLEVRKGALDDLEAICGPASP